MPEMPSRQHYSSRKEWEEACWDIIVRSPDVLNAVTTPYEKCGIARRALAVQRLEKGISYRDIGRSLWLSPQTISAIKKGARERTYRSYSDRGKTERKKSASQFIPGSFPFLFYIKYKYAPFFVPSRWFLKMVFT